MINTINISKYLTSAEFYAGLLRQVNYMKRFHRSNQPIILDFSETIKVEPLVIPNLLCLGKDIKDETGTRMVIRIPETVKAERLKFYLNQIDFIDRANDNIFDFENPPYSGISEGKQIDPLCGTLRFCAGLSRSEIRNGINGYVAPFTNEYLKSYDEYSEEEDIYVNKVDHFLYEMVDNCLLHGESDSFLTIHARYSDRKIYIAVSDLGKGFFESWNERAKEGDEDDRRAQDYILRGNRPKDELEALLCGIYRRKESRIYGLYNVTLQTLGLNGKIRIHSNDTQVLFTPRIAEMTEKGTVLNDCSFFKWNVKRGLEFKGAHIEMEVPF